MSAAATNGSDKQKSDTMNAKEFLASMGMTVDDVVKLKNALGGEQVDTSSQSSQPKDTKDLSTGDIASLMREVANLRSENDNLKSRNSVLAQKTSEEMRKQLVKVKSWLDNLQASDDQTWKKEFSEGLDRMADESAQESIVYQVACAASNWHEQNVMELERLRKENEDMGMRINGGRFGTEEGRLDKKRKVEVVSAVEENESDEKVGGLWGEIETFFKKENGIIS